MDLLQPYNLIDCLLNDRLYNLKKDNSPLMFACLVCTAIGGLLEDYFYYFLKVNTFYELDKKSIYLNVYLICEYLVVSK